MQATICSLCSNFLRTLHYHLHFCYRQLKLLKIPWKSFCPPQMEKTHSHNSSLMIFPGYFFSFYPKTFCLSEYGPSQKYNHASTSILSFLPKSRDARDAQMKSTWELAQQYLEIHLQDMQESIISSCRCKELHRLEFEATQKLFCCPDAFKLQSNEILESEMSL